MKFKKSNDTQSECLQSSLFSHSEINQCQLKYTVHLTHNTQAIVKHEEEWKWVWAAKVSYKNLTFNSVFDCCPSLVLCHSEFWDDTTRYICCDKLFVHNVIAVRINSYAVAWILSMHVFCFPHWFIEQRPMHPW